MEDDAVQKITLRVFSQLLEFSVSFDEIALFRAFERTAMRNEKLTERLDPDGFARRNGVIPPAAAIAREARLHFLEILPSSMRAEFERLLTAAYESGVIALRDFTGPGSPKLIQLPAHAIAPHASVMGRPSLKMARQRLLDRAAANARATHRKRGGGVATVDYASIEKVVDDELAKVPEGRGAMASAIRAAAERLGMIDVELLQKQYQRAKKRRSSHGHN